MIPDAADAAASGQTMKTLPQTDSTRIVIGQPKRRSEVRMSVISELVRLSPISSSVSSELDRSRSIELADNRIPETTE
jgi:hypothetical protein